VWIQLRTRWVFGVVKVCFPHPARRGECLKAPGFLIYVEKTWHQFDHIWVQALGEVWIQFGWKSPNKQLLEKRKITYCQLFLNSVIYVLRNFNSYYDIIWLMCAMIINVWYDCFVTFVGESLLFYSFLVRRARELHVNDFFWQTSQIIT